METFLYYLLRATIVAILLYGFYKLLFSKTTFYSTNRVALFLMLITIIALPLFRFQLLPETKEDVSPLEINTIDVTNLSTLEKSTGSNIDIQWLSLIAAIYFAGFAFFLIRYIIGIIQLIIIIKKSDKKGLQGNAVLCITEKQMEPFSWWSYIVISQVDHSIENNAIIDHEGAHVNLNHSVDRLFFDLFACVFWFNPFAWLVRRELQSVHEFQADERVLNNGIDAKKYQLLLIRKSVGEVKFALANNFLQRDLHKRITMMMKNKSNSRLKWCYIIVLPVLATTMVMLSIPNLNASISTQQAFETSDDITSNQKIIITDKPIDLSKQTSDLGESQIVSKDTVKIIINGDADKSQLAGKDSVMVVGQGNINETSRIKVRGMSTKIGENPLYIVDGVEMEKEIDDLNRDDVESVSMLKGKYAMEVYGEKGKNGVIIITTKNPEKKVKLNTHDLLIIVDDQEMPANFDMNSIDPADIESLSVLKDLSAAELFGEKGKNGVIIIKKKIKEVK